MPKHFLKILPLCSTPVAAPNSPILKPEERKKEDEDAIECGGGAANARDRGVVHSALLSLSFLACDSQSLSRRASSLDFSSRGSSIVSNLEFWTSASQLATRLAISLS